MKTRLMWMGAGLAVLVFFFLLCMGKDLFPPQPPPNIPSHVIVNPRMDEVIQAARNKVFYNPRQGKAWGELGMVFLANGFTAQADICFRQAAQLDTQDPKWPYIMALRLLLNERKESIGLLRKAVDLFDQKQPDFTTPRLSLVEILIELNSLQEAEEQCRLVLDRQPINPKALFFMGNLALAKEDYSAAIRFFTEASKSPYRKKRAASQLAILYKRLGDETQAVHWQKLCDDSPRRRLARSSNR